MPYNNESEIIDREALIAGAESARAHLVRLYEDRCEMFQTRDALEEIIAQLDTLLDTLPYHIGSSIDV